MEQHGHLVHDSLAPSPCPECQQMPVGVMTFMGQWTVRCRNPVHANESTEFTQQRAVEKWNEWCLQTQQKRAALNPKDDFWFLRLRADVLKCCGNPDNLDAVKFPNGVTKATCRKCGRAHRVMHSEEGIYGFK